MKFFQNTSSIVCQGSSDAKSVSQSGSLAKIAAQVNLWFENAASVRTSDFLQICFPCKKYCCLGPRGQLNWQVP
jgi:hypothetical protein